MKSWAFSTGIVDPSHVPITTSPISFEQFMARALHDPEHGYYARHILAVGRSGDFTTAPMLSDAPARAIAAWASAALKVSGCRDLIEIGPGEGKLAAAVMKHLPWSRRWKTRLHLVETSAPLAARQQERLSGRATWHSSLTAALASCDGRAVIFSNELVDAFSVRRFQKTAIGWQELAVSFDARKQPHESLLPLAPLPDSTSFSELHACGQWVEVHESYRRYLADWLPLWKAGRLLTLDYGAEAAVLYQRRPQGSIRAYFHHQRLEGPAIYLNPGHQDLTADVNFTDLIHWSQPWVSDLRLCSMSEFLRGHSSKDDAQLCDDEGAGGAFLVLDQKCAVGD